MRIGVDLGGTKIEIIALDDNGAPALQRPGLVGVRSAANLRVSNLPLTALVDSLQVVNLDPMITYSYAVAAQDSHGNTSALSAPISVTLR